MTDKTKEQLALEAREKKATIASAERAVKKAEEHLRDAKAALAQAKKENG